MNSYCHYRERTVGKGLAHCCSFTYCGDFRRKRKCSTKNWCTGNCAKYNGMYQLHVNSFDYEMKT